MNLYIVTDAYYEYCCFVIEKTRGRAKAWAAGFFGEDFLDVRCRTLKKGVEAEKPFLITDETDEGYDIVLACGSRFYDPDEQEEDWL